MRTFPYITPCLLIAFFLTSFHLRAQYRVIPDTLFEEALIELGIDSDSTINGRVLNDDIVDVIELDVREKGIIDLTGIEGFEKLRVLNGERNKIKNLDLSANKDLAELYCSSNPLSNIDLTQNCKLRILHFGGTEFDSLDLTGNQMLQEMKLSRSSELVHVDLSNQKSLKFIWLRGVDNLDSLDFSSCDSLETLFFLGDYMDTFSVSQNRLLKNLYFTGFFMSTIDLSNNPELEELRCSNNELTHLDLSHNKRLKLLDCSDHKYDYGLFNHIRELDLSENHRLEEVYCVDVGLERLNINGCYSLKKLYCGLNPLEELDVSHNTQLETLSSVNCTLEKIDLTKNLNLSEVYLLNGYNHVGYEYGFKNNFSEIDLSQCPKLRNLGLSNNGKLEYLQIQNGNNDSLELNILECDSLACIIVDDSSDIPDRWKYEPVSQFYESEDDCQLVTSEESADVTGEFDISIYPNPASDKLYLDFDCPEDVEVSVFVPTGEVVMKKTLSENRSVIPLDEFSEGVYYILVRINKDVMTRKLIVAKSSS
ncbi:MAG: T9SS type A sorting domain-containing protein [Saprospiraceae bacterium]|nr:T9SS type A sorting domain-containing protein [Saprospiraceae bacterium]